MGLFVCQFLGNLINWTKEKLMHLPQCGIEKANSNNLFMEEQRVDLCVGATNAIDESTCPLEWAPKKWTAQVAQMAWHTSSGAQCETSSWHERILQKALAAQDVP